MSTPRLRLVRALRILGRALGITLALVTLALSATILYARTNRGRESLRKLAVTEGRKSLPGLSIGAIGGDYVREVWLRDVEVRDDHGQPAIHVDRLSVRFRLLSLFARTVAVDELRIDGARIRAKPDDRGGLNLAHLVTPSTKSPSEQTAARPSAWRVRIERIAVSGVTAAAQMPDGGTGSIGGLHLTGSLWMGGGRTRGSVEELEAGGAWNDRAYALSLAGAEVTIGSADLAARVLSLRVVGLLPQGAPLDLRAEAAGPLDRVAGGVDVRLGEGGELHVGGSAGLVEDGQGGRILGRYDLGVRVTELDPARLMDGAPPGPVNLELGAHGRGGILSPGAEARVDAVARAPGTSVTLAAQSAGKRLQADVELTLDSRAGRGRMSLHAEGTWPENVAVHVRGDVRGLRLRELRLGSLRLALDGRAALEPGSALSAAQVNARAEVRLSELAVADTRVGAGDLRLDVEGTPAAPSGTLRVRARAVVATPTAPRIDAITLDASGNRGGLRAQAAVIGPRLRGGLRAHGAATAEAATVTLDGLSLHFKTRAYEQTLDLERPALLRYRAGERIAVDHLALRGSGARFTGAAAIDAEVRLPASRREPLARATVALRGASTSGLPPTDARIEGMLTGQRATVRLDATMPSAGAHLHLDGDLPLEASRGATPRLAPHGRVAVHVESNQVRLQTIPVVERALARQGITGGTATLDLDVTGDIAHPDARGTFEVRDVMYRNIAGLGRDSTLKTIPGLGGSLKVETRPGDINLAARLLIRNTGVLEAKLNTPVDLGRIIAGAKLAELPVHALVEIPQLELASLADFTDGLKDVAGQLHGKIDLSGTLSRPAGRADLAVDGARVGKVTFRQVHLHAEGDRGRLASQLTLEQTGGGRLDGSLAVERARGDRIRGFLTAKDLDVGFARVFLTNVRELGGVAQLSATADGSVSAPNLRASLALENGRLGVTGQPTFQQLRLAATLGPGRADLQRVEVHSGGGSLDGKGWVLLSGPLGLSPQSAVFAAHAHRFLVAVAGSTGARIDGDLAVNAALREDVLTGRVEIPDANVWLPKGPPTGAGRALQRIGPHADVHFVDQTALAALERDRERQRRAAASALRFAVTARANPVYLRGKDLDIEVHSNLKIETVATGPHAGAPTVSGGIHIPRGRINIQGQRFDFDHGNVTFNGSYELDPQLDIKLERQFPEAMVVVELRGTPKKPELRMSSDPAVYDQAQIVSLILTGQPGGQPSTGKSFDPTAAVTTAVMSKLADQVAPALGLDVMRVEGQEVKNEEGGATGDTDTRVEVGKYISERIYLSYAHIFGAPENANQNEAHVEYRMTRRLMMESIFGDAGQGGVDALWTYRF